MLAQIFGEGEKPLSVDAVSEKPAALQAPEMVEQIAPPEAAADVTSPTDERVEASPPEIATGAQQIAQSEFVQRDNNTALHNNSSNDDSEEPKSRRHHGSALPQ